MTKLTPEEDFALCSPEMIEADIKGAERDAIWNPLAKHLGWYFSPAHNAFINKDFRDPLILGQEGYHIAYDCESACYMSGYKTVLEAIDALEKI